jgi:copper chaperone
MREGNMEKTYKVSGMTCGGCARSVEKAIKAVAPAAGVTIDVATGNVRVEGAVDEGLLAKAVDDAGFEFMGRA